MAEVIKCAKCGACTSVCPVYKTTGQETHSARGKIHLLERIPPKERGKNYNSIFSQCLLCGACYRACPRDINTPSLIAKARADGSRMHGFTSYKKLLLQKSLSHPSLIKPLLLMKGGKNLLSKLLPKSSGLRSKLQLFDQSNTDSSSQHFCQSQNNTQAHKPDAAYFVGCLANYLFHDIATASKKCLTKLCNINLTAPQEQGCCGLAAFASGSTKEAVALAKKNIELFNKAPFADLPIFTSCASCYSHLKTYPILLRNDPEWQDAAQLFSQRVLEFSSYILQYSDNYSDGHLTEKATPLSIYYHDPCHLRFPPPDSKDITQEPRKLLQMLPNINLFELSNGPQCCGHGGLFNIAHPELSQNICNPIFSELDKKDLPIVTTTCSGCLLQLQTDSSGQEANVKVMHLALLMEKYLK